MKDQKLWSLQRLRDQAISIQLKKDVLKDVLAILTTCMEIRLKGGNCMTSMEAYFTDSINTKWFYCFSLSNDLPKIIFNNNCFIKADI